MMYTHGINLSIYYGCWMYITLCCNWWCTWALQLTVGERRWKYQRPVNLCAWCSYSDIMKEQWQKLFFFLKLLNKLISLMSVIMHIGYCWLLFYMHVHVYWWSIYYFVVFSCLYVLMLYDYKQVISPSQNNYWFGFLSCCVWLKRFDFIFETLLLCFIYDSHGWPTCQSYMDSSKTCSE